MSDLNDKLASLQQRLLERDDESDPLGGRIYRDKVSGEIYHSVTEEYWVQQRIQKNNKKP